MESEMDASAEDRVRAAMRTLAGEANRTPTRPLTPDTHHTQVPRSRVRYPLVAAVAAALVGIVGVAMLLRDTPDDLTVASPAAGTSVSDEFSSMYVISAGSAVVDGGSLILADLDAEVVSFTDLPRRRVSRVSVEDLVTSWDALFGDQPASAVIAYSWDDARLDAAIELIELLSFDATGITFSFEDVESPPDRVAPLVAFGAHAVPSATTDIRLFVDYTSSTTITMTFEICDHAGTRCAVPPAGVIDAINIGEGNEAIEVHDPPGGYVTIDDDGTVKVSAGASTLTASIGPGACYTKLSDLVHGLCPSLGTVVDWARGALSTPDPEYPTSSVRDLCHALWTPAAEGGTISCLWAS